MIKDNLKLTITLDNGVSVTQVNDIKFFNGDFKVGYITFSAPKSLSYLISEINSFKYFSFNFERLDWSVELFVEKDFYTFHRFCDLNESKTFFEVTK